MLPTSVPGPVELLVRVAERLDESWPQIQHAAVEAVLDEANGVRPQDRRVERRAMEEDLGDQLFQEFLAGLAVKE